MAVVPAELSNITIDNLPAELLREVMLRVPTPAALVHAAAVSKRWRGIITNRTGRFLDDYREHHQSSPLLGLYIPREFGGLPSFQKADSIQSAGDRDLDLQRPATKAFNLGGLESHPEWRLLDCYNGRLLLARGHDSLEVYNPLSCERIKVRLPQDGILPSYFSACLLQGHDDDAASFRVVSVQHDRRRRDRIVRAVEYDSCKKSWKDHPWDWETLKNIEGTQQGEMMHAGNFIFCKYTGTFLLLLDTRQMQFSALPLPTDNNWKHYAIGEMEDGVCCLASVDSAGIWNKKHLRVWKLEKLKWTMEKEMDMEQVLGKHAHGRFLFYKVHAVTNGIALLCSSMHQLHFVVDLKTFFVKDKFEFKDRAFPMQMPWPPAFSVATVSAEQSAPYTCVQEAITAAPTLVRAEECFDKEDNIPNDHDLEAQIPVQDSSLCVMWGKTYSRRRKRPQENKTLSLCHQLPAGLPPPATTLCDEDSGLIHTEAEAQSNEYLSGNAARALREPQRRSNRKPKPNPRVKGPDWTVGRTRRGQAMPHEPKGNPREEATAWPSPTQPKSKRSRLDSRQN
ncbi:uncharacterized protein LOC120662067 isoform X2 [Panicum virgatum]|uniref:uncharacterized protein LOC120662067 isoform X2 n=1 Tax=Panicum virgatum TaxID=38727 RepID=UPI0019D4F202|nr:uncharacterized protein LOC120662067 isoform X2 [Panicum virgatum]